MVAWRRSVLAMAHQPARYSRDGKLAQCETTLDACRAAQSLRPARRNVAARLRDALVGATRGPRADRRWRRVRRLLAQRRRTPAHTDRRGTSGQHWIRSCIWRDQFRAIAALRAR